MSEQLVHGDLVLGGTLGFKNSLSGFPENPKPRHICVVDGMPYMWTDIVSGFFTWFPMAVKQTAHIHAQGVPATEWLITHGFGTQNYGLFVYDTDHNLIMAGHHPVDDNSVVVTLTEAVEGTAVLFAAETFGATALSGGTVSVGTIVLRDNAGKLSANNADLAYQANTYTKAETDTRIQNVVGAAPAALDTLQELSAALGDDANFAGSITTSLAGKADKADTYTKAESDAAMAALPKDFDSLTGKPTTVAGYGITDAYTKSQVDTAISTATPATATQTTLGVVKGGTNVTIGADGSVNAQPGYTDAEAHAAFSAGGDLSYDSATGQFSIDVAPYTAADFAADAANADLATNASVDTKVATKAALVHAHAMSDVTGLSTALAGKAAVATTLAGYGITDAYTKTETDTRIQAVVGAAPAALDTLKEIADQLAIDESVTASIINTLAAKADAVDYYTQAEVDALLLAQADTLRAEFTAAIADAMATVYA